MKTHKVRPVLVETKENTGITLGINITRNIPGVFRGQNYQLILISLEDEEIEVGDKCYCSRENRIIINQYHTNITPTRKKIVATQNQLSPQLIQQLIDEYNNGGMKDFEIKMEYHDKPMSDLFLIQKPKLTNGFVTIVKEELNTKEIGKPLDDYIRSKHTQEECIGFIDGYNARRNQEPILYTEEEVYKLCNEACMLTDSGEISNNVEFKEWFEQNKKK